RVANICSAWHSRCSMSRGCNGSRRRYRTTSLAHRQGCSRRGTQGLSPTAATKIMEDDIMASQNRGTSNRGFASMDPEKQRQIASKGGKASHARGTAHEFTSEEASRAGRKAHAQGNAHEWTSEDAREAGRTGGLVSGSNRR